MRRMFQLLIVLFLIYFGIEFIYNYLGHGHETKYLLSFNNKTFNIKELLSLNGIEEDNYMIEVSTDNVVIPFKIYNTYSKKQKIVSKIDYIVKDGYNCMALKLEEDDSPTDIKCLKDGIIYSYNDIVGRSSSLDADIKNLNYNTSKFTNDYSQRIEKSYHMVVYPANFPKKSYIVVDNYRGVFLLGSSVNNYIRTIDFFLNDVSNKEISGLVDKYYVVANYNSSHEFNEFNYINLKVGDYNRFKVSEYISFNSFVQGVHNNSLYIIDKDAKKQYAIDLSTKELTVTSDLNNKAVIYNNGVEETKSIIEVINNKIVFSKETDGYKEGNYEKIVLHGDKENGTYYLFQRNGSKYDVYTRYTGSDVMTYAFTTSSIDNIAIKDGFFYYLDESSLMVFSPSYGKKKIFDYGELKYNKDIKYMIY